ncbi:MAG: hypothetical protein II837_03190, partial [Treponema sp.]|nr:hypothetical protein [Treponema sp.]
KAENTEDKLEEMDKSKPFLDNIHALCDSLDDKAKDFMLEDVTDYGKDFLYDRLEELRDEYDGLDVDLSKQERELAAIRQIAHRLRPCSETKLSEQT